MASSCMEECDRSSGTAPVPHPKRYLLGGSGFRVLGSLVGRLQRPGCKKGLCLGLSLAESLQVGCRRVSGLGFDYVGLRGDLKVHFDEPYLYLHMNLQANPQPYVEVHG